MVISKKAFSLSLLLHVIVIMLLSLDFYTHSIGDVSVSVIHASLYSELLPSQSTRNIMHMTQSHVSSLHHYGVINENSRREHGKHLTNKQCSQASKKLTKGKRNKLLFILHDAIAKHKQYPVSAAALGQTGEVTLGFMLYPSGNVSVIQVIKSSNFAVIDQAAIMALQHASPIPAASRYMVSPGYFEVEVDFR